LIACRAAALVIALALLAAPSRARAQAATDGRAEAQVHLDRGNDLFTGDKFQEALTEFQAAFAAFPSPKLRFNIGQCQRALGHRKDALDEFRRFLADATDVPPELRREAERYVDELQADEPRATTTTTTPPTAISAPTSPPTLTTAPAVGASPALLSVPPTPEAAPDAARPLYKRWWFWAVVGVVAVGAVAGAVLLTRPRDPSCTGMCYPP